MQIFRQSQFNVILVIFQHSINKEDFDTYSVFATMRSALHSWGVSLILLLNIHKKGANCTLE